MNQFKRVAIEAPTTQFRWDRGIDWYWIVAVLDPSKTPGKLSKLTTEQRDAHETAVKPGWRGSIFELKSPIMVDRSLAKAFVSDCFAIYSPFKLNREKSITHSFDDVDIPVLPKVHSSRFQCIPDYAIRGAVADIRNNSTSDVCYGVRIDAAKDVDSTLVLEMFLRLVRQETKQWWVTSARNPFDYGYRMSFELNKDFSPRDVLMDPDLDEIQTPWAANIATQKLIGIESSLTLAGWVNIAKHVENGGKAESAIALFFDAVAAFMAYKDTQAILLLALFFEVAENKARLLKGGKHESKNKNILRTPLLATSNQIGVFRKLITDRDNIAHGKGPYHQKKDPTIMVSYMDTAAAFFNSYLNLCRQFDWKEVVALEL